MKITIFVIEMKIEKYTNEINLADIGVYIITHNNTPTVYVGSTCCKGGFAERWRHHILYLERGKNNPVLTNICKKYGIEGFRFSILERMNGCTQEEIRKRERYYIEKYDSYTHGANCSLSTDCSFRVQKHFPNTPEKCQKYKDTCTTKKPMYVYNGKGELIYTFESSVEADRFFGLKKGSCGDKAREGWSLNGKYWFSRTKKDWIPEQLRQERIKQGQERAAKTRRENGSYDNRPIRSGFHVSEKAKIKARVSNKISMKVDLYNLDGSFYKSFESLNECDDFLGLTRGATSKVLKNKAKTLKRKYIPVKHTNTVLTD